MLPIAGALLILVAVVAAEIKRSIDIAEHWDNGEHDWNDTL